MPPSGQSVSGKVVGSDSQCDQQPEAPDLKDAAAAAAAASP